MRPLSQRGLPAKPGGGFLLKRLVCFSKGKPSVICFANATSLCEGRLCPHPQSAIAKRTKKPPSSFKNLPNIFEKPLDTHGPVVV